MTRTSLPSGSTISGHRLGFDIMRMCGIDPIAAVDAKIPWPEGYVPDYVENHNGTLRMRMALDSSHNVQVIINGEEARISVKGQTFPDSARIGLIGAPISKIVDHVLFTGSSLHVEVVEPFVLKEEGAGTHFILNEASNCFTAP